MCAWGTPATSATAVTVERPRLVGACCLGGACTCGWVGICLEPICGSGGVDGARRQRVVAAPADRLQSAGGVCRVLQGALVVGVATLTEA